MFDNRLIANDWLIGMKQETLGKMEKEKYSFFFFPNSQFPIPNSQFPIPNSQFPIPNSQFNVL